jgi:cardiolipin synthase
MGAHLPNVITIARLLLAPVIVWLILSGAMQAAFFVSLAAGLSDAVDGHLARRFRWKTELGAFLDPIADKLLMICLYATLAAIGLLPVWLAIAVVSRDILIIGAVMLSWLLAKPLAMQPLALSKLNTAAQVTLALLALAEAAFSLGAAPLLTALVWSVAALTFASAGAYLLKWLRHMANGGATSPGAG